MVDSGLEYNNSPQDYSHAKALLAGLTLILTSIIQVFKQFSRTSIHGKTTNAVF
jgi:hypothetical protein